MKFNITPILYLGIILSGCIAAVESQSESELRKNFNWWEQHFHSEWKNWKALCKACEVGNVTVAEEMMKKGADINREDQTGWTPLIVAVWSRQDNIVKSLLKYEVNVNHSLHTGWTPLYIAAENGHEGIVESLINKGADVNVKVPNSGWTPLHMAAKNGHEGIVVLLIGKGADFELTTSEGWSSFDLANENGHKKIADLLERIAKDHKGINPTVVSGNDLDQWETLCEAAKSGNLTLAQQLIKNGTDVNRESETGSTPLTIAVWNRRKSIVDLMLKNGADVNHTLSTGWSSLHIAAESGDEEIAEMLISNRADINKRIKNNGWTPLHNAAENGNERIVHLLIRMGANVTLTTLEELTAVDLANENDHANIVDLLKKAMNETNDNNFIEAQKIIGKTVKNTEYSSTSWIPIASLLIICITITILITGYFLIKRRSSNVSTPAPTYSSGAERTTVDFVRF